MLLFNASNFYVREGCRVAYQPQIMEYSDCLVLKDISYGCYSNLNLNIRGGEVTAITGPQGVDKATLLKIMLGVLPPDKGNVFWNQVPIYPNHALTYRRCVAAVLQKGYIFPGTVQENITLLNPICDRARMEFCTREAQVFDDIRSLPLGFETEIGFGGAKLTIFQKRKLCVARAFYINPSILFLDDFIHHTSLEWQLAILRYVRRVGLTTVLVTNTPEILEMVDKIFYLPQVIH